MWELYRRCNCLLSYLVSSHCCSFGIIKERNFVRYCQLQRHSLPIEFPARKCMVSRIMDKQNENTSFETSQKVLSVINPLVT
jgi:hypothetical protein